MKFRTQKAQGIHALGIHGIGISTLPYRVVQEEAQVGPYFNGLASEIGFHADLFARPCPENPAHGFVDSRKVTSIDEALAVWKEAVAADPKAEMILMPRVEAECNAIYAGNYLALGPGHDGATGGKNSFGLKVTNGIFSPELITASRINVEGDEVPYVEVVYGTLPGRSDVTAYATQVRSGPRMAGSDNLIFTKGPITQIYIPTKQDEDDLLHWKQQAVELAKIPDLVVWHPGGTPACHVAVHCAVNHINYLTFNPNDKSKNPPKVGDIFEDITPDFRDPMVTRDGVMAASVLQMPFTDALRVVLFGLHQSGLNLTPTGSRLVGSAAALCIRLSTAACLGELRHKARKGGFFHHNRSIVLKKAWDDHFTSQKMMGAALKSFFEKRWNSGYGGHAWGVCAMRNMELADACLSVFKDPSMATVGDMTDRLNVLVNTIHNGGWQFNKFANQQIMDQAAQSTPTFMLESGLGLYRALTCEVPSDSKWSTVRKTRALTEIRKRVDIDEIARKRQLMAVEKLGGKLDPETYAKLQEEKAKVKAEQAAKMAAIMKQKEEGAALMAAQYATQFGNPTKIQAYLHKDGSNIHFQWVCANAAMNGKGYFSCDIHMENANLYYAAFNLIKDIDCELPSLAAGSNSKYFGCYLTDNVVSVNNEYGPISIVDMKYLWNLYAMACNG
jgi:hypothetical protein